MRAGARAMPTALNAAYYTQRSSAGLIISEGTAISPGAHGYRSDPGIYTAEQIAGWRSVTDAVHAHGGRIILQIAHNGRNSHSSLMPDATVPVAPSAFLGIFLLSQETSSRYRLKSPEPWKGLRFRSSSLTFVRPR